LFSDSELKIITFAKEHFKDFNAGQIMHFSHKEKGYEETSNGKPTSYQCANELQI